MAPLIRGEVVEIISKNKVVLNVGSEDGVTENMDFVIYAEAGHIFDQSGNDLGPLEVPKAEVEVIAVQENLAIAQNVATKTIVPLFPLWDTQEKITQAFGGNTSVEDLPVDPKDIKEFKVDMVVRKGDKARQIP